MTAEAMKDAFAEKRFPLVLCLAHGQRVQVKHRDYRFVPPGSDRDVMRIASCGS
jgi:hypothetical protein